MSKFMKTLFNPFVFLLFLVSSSMAAEQLVDGIAAVVGEDIILYSDVQQVAVELARQYQVDLRNNQEAYQRFQEMGLRELINSKVLILQAEKDSIVVKDRDVEQALESQIQQYLSYFGGSESAMEAAFGMSVSKIRDKMYDRVKSGLIQQQIQSEKFNKIKITRPEVIEFYNANKDSIPPIPEKVDISHILITPHPSEANLQLTRQFLDSLRAAILNGNITFEEAAAKYSKDPGSAPGGGELGMVPKGTFVKEFEKAAYNLAPGDISPVIETQFGLHIIQLIEKRGEMINVRHILIPVNLSETDVADVINKLSTIAKSIKTKADFDSAAVLYSEDPESVKNKGDLGEFALNSMQIPAFAEVISPMTVGEISGPFQTDYGYHIVRLNDRKPEEIITLDNHYVTLESFSLDQKRRIFWDNWINSLYDKYYVEIRM